MKLDLFCLLELITFSYFYLFVLTDERAILLLFVEYKRTNTIYPIFWCD